MEIFKLFRALINPDGYYLQNHKTLKIYSNRSLEREAKSLNTLLEDMKTRQKTLIWISPFHVEIYSHLAPHLLHNLAWVVPVSFSAPDNARPEVIDSPEKFRYFLNGIGRNQSFQILGHSLLKEYQLEETVRGMLNQAAIRLKTISFFSNLWKNNFKDNHIRWRNCRDIKRLDSLPPDLVLLGGPSVDTWRGKIHRDMRIWCADTAIPFLVSEGIAPDVTFSIDAGFASYEHFLPALPEFLSGTKLVLDPLSFPPLYRIRARELFTYTHSNPLLQQQPGDFTFLENETNDVYGLIHTVHVLLFGCGFRESAGRDRGPSRKITHYRGSAYHRRQYNCNTRLTTPETYFLRLSKRYTHM